MERFLLLLKNSPCIDVEMTTPEGFSCFETHFRLTLTDLYHKEAL